MITNPRSQQRTRWRLGRLFGIGLGCLVLVSCQAPPATHQVDDQAGSAVHDLAGRPFQFSDYRGRWVLVHYWASWCEHCIAEIPTLADLQSRRSDVQVVGVNVEGLPVERLQALVSTHQIPYPQLDLDPGQKLGIGPVTGVPVLWIVDPQGQVRPSPLLGPQTLTQLEAALS